MILLRVWKKIDVKFVPHLISFIVDYFKKCSLGEKHPSSPLNATIWNYIPGLFSWKLLYGWTHLYSCVIYAYPAGQSCLWEVWPCIHTPHIRLFTCEKKNTYILKVIFTCMCKHTFSSVASETFLNSLNIKYSLPDVKGNLPVFLDLIVLVKIKKNYRTLILTSSNHWLRHQHKVNR